MPSSAVWMAALGLMISCTKDTSRDKPHVDTDTGPTTIDTAGNPTESGSDRRIDAAGDSGADSDGVRLCALSGGAVVVIWVDDRDGARAIWSRASADGGASWPDDPVKVNDASAMADHPAMVCEGDTAYVAWEDDRDSNVADANIYFAKSEGGSQSWSANTLVGGTDLGANENLEPRLAVAGDEVHIVWHSDANGAFDIYTTSSADRGASFSDPLRIDSDTPGTAWSSNATIATDGLGRVYVTWEDRRIGVGDIYVAASSNSGVTFGNDARLDSGVGDSYRPEIAAANGEAYVAWYDERDGEKLEIYAAYSADGGSSWAEAARLSEGTPGEKDSVLPQVILADGTLHATWFQAGGGGLHVEYRQLEAGVPSTDIVQLDHAPQAAETTYPALVQSADGWVVAWRDDRAATDDGDNDLYYVHSDDNGATWTAPDLRVDAHPSGTTFAVDHSVSVADGALLAAWSDGRNGSADVFFTRLALGEEATE